MALQAESTCCWHHQVLYQAVPHVDFRSISCRFSDNFHQKLPKRPFSGFLHMDQKSTVFGVPWHGSKTTFLQDSSHGPGVKRQKIARNGSGIYENQHNLVKMARNFDASPAVTTGRPQDPFLVSKRVETARSAAWGASPLNFMLFRVILQGCNLVCHMR